jgi:hypothetical protein
MSRPLTPEEDAELRRLHVLAQYADAAPWLLARYRELRDQDRRASVRAVSDDELVQLLPVQASDEFEPYPTDA